ncbi:MAG TPA: DNA cytosine methyltransferase [Solirubrobacterales bacterium]|nr:DNA cytosine methyltransferase [Solirubrobacterales bacterium]HMU26179.1 DNA cytosine methyltransferase [Solirubrobacterales bacterium]HMX70290.1 DNA cytosine methyltransferase [Solirubrobacterales bacterium]HMY25809.1 DNA cytosine methyltransferase [Solirubrobacterales bacterium]HNA23657.1 DNA cytosine methyltransferase [Solirubrobacterales bacterium]
MSGERLFEDQTPSLCFEERVNLLLEPKRPGSPLVLDLFAGCGGLALGFESAGFETLGFETNPDCVATYRSNLSGDCLEVNLTRDFDFPAKADVIIGGPPCQPFSVRGSQKGNQDARNGFPAFLAAVEQIAPDLVIAENVRGMLYRNREYLDEVVQKLRDFGYSVEVELLNAKNFGVPQNRERVIIVGHRLGWDWPDPSDFPLVTAGEALGDMAFEIPPDSKFLTSSMDRYIAEYERKSGCARPRDLHLDRPARTLTCRNLAGATSDMHRLLLPDGRRRRITTKEAARLQTFPDWFQFCGTELSVFNQIGNAVPPLFSLALAEQAKLSLGLQGVTSTV